MSFSATHAKGRKCIIQSTVYRRYICTTTQTMFKNCRPAIALRFITSTAKQLQPAICAVSYVASLLSATPRR